MRCWPTAALVMVVSKHELRLLLKQALKLMLELDWLILNVIWLLWVSQSVFLRLPLRWLLPQLHAPHLSGPVLCVSFCGLS